MSFFEDNKKVALSTIKTPFYRLKNIKEKL